MVSTLAVSLALLILLPRSVSGQSSDSAASMPAVTSEDRVETLEAVLQHNFTALGGPTLASVSSIRMVGSVEVENIPPMPIALEWKRPGKIRIETTVGDFKLIQGSAGGQAWSQDPKAGLTEGPQMPANVRLQLQRSADEMFLTLRDAQARGHNVELVKSDPKAVVLRRTRPDGSVDVVTLDSSSYLEAKRESLIEMPGMSYESIQEPSDYRSIEGVLVPFVVAVRPKGVEAGMTIRYRSIVMNPELPDERFAPPK